MSRSNHPSERRPHQWRSMTITPVEMIEVEGEQVAIPTGDTEERIGCWTCNVGYGEEAPFNCDGIDIEEIYELS